MWSSDIKGNFLLYFQHIYCRSVYTLKKIWMQTQINITHSFIPLVQAGLVSKMIISIVIMPIIAWPLAHFALLQGLHNATYATHLWLQPHGLATRFRLSWTGSKYQLLNSSARVVQQVNCFGVGFEGHIYSIPQQSSNVSYWHYFFHLWMFHQLPCLSSIGRGDWKACSRKLQLMIWCIRDCGDGNRY